MASFSFGGAGAASNLSAGAPNPVSTAFNPQQQQQQQSAAPPTLTIPLFDQLFPGRSVANKVGSLLRTSTATTNGDNSLFDGQELIAALSNTQDEKSIAQRLLLLHQDPTLQPVQPNQALRQRLAQNPTVLLSIEQQDGSVQLREATLAPNMLQDVFGIADDLQISEEAAICLYQQASASDKPFHSFFVQRCLKDSNVSAETTAAWCAREMYFAQSPLLLRTCLSLLQHRLVGAGENASSCACEATDSLLQAGWINNFVQMIRISTQRISQVMASYNNSAMGANGTTSTTAQFWGGDVTLQSFFEKRQIAVECLFFAAYNVQHTAEEIGALIDLVQELTDASIVLDPLYDVPNPFEVSADDAMGNSAAAAPWLFHHPQREKDPLVWQQELAATCWKTGQPQLMRCFCTLVMTVLSALGNRAVLMDRNTHAQNTFGAGNALLSPGSTSITGLAAVHNRLSEAAIANWKRADVLGLLMAAYAMLLRSSPAAMSSPRASGAGSGPGSNVDIRKTWRQCLESSHKQKSITFARICMIPALQKPAQPVSEEFFAFAAPLPCDTSEFLQSVLAEFASQYLDILSSSGEGPVSRAKWEQDAEEELRLRRSNQEQQRSFRGQFRDWSDSEALEAVPAAVDLLERTDCVDDIIAFAVAVCSLGAEYVLPFWLQETHNREGNGDEEPREYVKLVPSRALRDLAEQQRKDESLCPSYLSFLAALALAQNPSCGDDGADVVHSMFSGHSGNRYQRDWPSLIEVLRWYVMELRPQSYTTRGSATSSSSSQSTTSTAYYYFNEGSASSQASNNRPSGDSSVSPKPRELGEENTFILLSHLALITNVAAKSSAARSAIVSINLPIKNPDGSVVGQDSAMMVLFYLALLPLTPKVRGAVFETLSQLLSIDGCSKEEAADMRSAALKGWEHLEACQIIPISMLEQYPSAQQPGSETTTELAFPLSSTAVAADSNRNSWIPADPRYAIVYEMEFVESSLGYYPSTEGFLRLLRSLFAVGGSPSDLGHNWRGRPGCSPYIEYVLSFVLPAALGLTSNIPALPFRSINDKSRLCALSLEVVQSVLFRYTVPSTAALPKSLLPEKLADHFYSLSEAAAREVIGHKELVRRIVLLPHKDEAKLAQEDFLTVAPRKGSKKSESDVSNDFLAASQSDIVPSPIPRSKTPAFAVMASILSTSGDLFAALVSILVDEDNHAFSDVSSDIQTMANALYINTPPRFSAAKEAAGKMNVPSSAREALIALLCPASSLNAAAHWGTRAIVSALRIFLATFSREELFQQCLSAAPTSISIVPVLRFQKRKHVPTAIELQPSKLSQQLLFSDSNSGVLSSLIDLVGFISTDERSDVSIASAAIATLFCIERAFPRNQIGEILGRGDARRGRRTLVRAFEKRFLVASTRVLDLPDIDMLQWVLGKLLRDLKMDRTSGETFTDLLFEHWEEGISGPKSSDDCLESILRLLLSVVDCIFDPQNADLAASCYEIIYHLTNLVDGRTRIDDALHIADRLRNIDFWRIHLLKLFSAISSAPDGVIDHRIVHAIAWLLKGAAGELHLLAGFTSVTSSGHELVKAPNLGQYKSICRLLFSDGRLVERALIVLPIEKPSFVLSHIPPSISQTVSELKEELQVYPGYWTVNADKLVAVAQSRGIHVDEDGLRFWADQWNQGAKRDCASTHLSDAIRSVVGASVCSSRFASSDLSPQFVAGSELLVLILERMTVRGDPNKNSRLLDETLFTTACRNLASAAVSAASFNHVVDESKSVSRVSAATACILLVRAIACSGDGGMVGPDLRRNESIAYLATALVLTLKYLPDQFLTEQLQRDGAHSFFYHAAVVLSNLSCNVLADQIPATPSQACLVSRTCLYSLLGILESSWTGHSCCRAILTDVSLFGSTQAPIRSMIDLIPRLDGRIATLLQSLATFPGVADLLLEHDILQALMDAAEYYVSEEAKYLASEARNALYGQTNIGPPPFLIGHLELLGALMVAATQPPASTDRRRGIASMVTSIVRTYNSVFERLFASFPLDGDVVTVMVRCLAQADILERTSGDFSALTLHRNLVVDDGLGAPLRSSVASLSMHLAEYPLPEHFLGQLPSRLHGPSHCHTGAGIVAAAAMGKKSWWDTLDKQTPSMGGDQLLEKAVLGAELLRYGLQLCQGSSSTMIVDENALSRSLFRCSEAAVWIERSLKSSHLWQEQFLLFRSKIIAVVAELLRLLIAQVDAVKTGRIAPSSGTEAFCQTVTFTLDHTRLETSMIWYSEPHGTDENSPSYIMNLARALRKALDQ